MTGALNGLPEWAKALLALSSVAFSMVVALFFLAQSAGYVPSIMATKEQLELLRQDNYTMRRVLQQVCMNTARDAAERAGCWP